MKQTHFLIVVMVAMLGLSGCATVSRESLQYVNIVMNDYQGQPLSGAQCRVESSALSLVGNTPMMQVPVPRSGSALVIECIKPGVGEARSIARSRSSGNQLMILIQPFAGTAIDHMSGRMYDYPATITLVAGKELVWDARQTEPVSARVLPAGRLAALPDRLPSEP